ncbi:sericin 1 isoform X2 [Medicago truncatula]|uniref:sericin 1 isoform X2 n=1 Tax=Medicago truncatula TaxID=3880 RepID=UPI000D2F1A61|nr:sericin 1 isoform X2 [Medicago truncatula]
MLHRSFKPAKCKTALKLAVSRIKLLRNKRQTQINLLKRELAKLLENGQDQTARIRVEHVVREEKTMAAYELVEIYCELIAARLPMIEAQKNCPIDLKEAIATVIFATPRCSDIPELADVKKHMTSKYGKEFTSAALELRPDCGVNRLLVEKLSAKAPDGPTKIKILTAIAEEHNIDWEPKSFGDNDTKASHDLLDGPSTLQKPAYEEPFQAHVPPPVHVEARPPSSHATSQPKPMHDAYTSSYEQSANAAARNANNSTTSGMPITETRSSGGGSQEMDFRDSYSENRSSFPTGRQNWNMEFKDAASAAQAAAESADRATMAARAAAEFSNRENMKRQHSSGSHSSPGRGSRDEAPTDSSGFVNSPIRKSSSGIHNEQIITGEQDNLGGRSNENYSNSHQNVVKDSRPASTIGGSVGDDNPFAHGSPMADTDHHDTFFKQESSNLYAMSMKKQASRAKEDFDTEHADVERNTENSYHFEDASTNRQSGHSSSSHPFIPSNDPDDNLNSYEWTTGNKAAEDLFVTEVSTQEPTSYNHTSVVFDDSESDDGDYKFDDDKKYNSGGSGLLFSSPSSKSQVDPFENTNSWNSGKNTDVKETSSGTQSHFSVSENFMTSEVSFDKDPLPATFDDSDDPGSDSETDLVKSRVSRTFDDGSSVLDQIANHGTLGSSSGKVKNLGTDRNSWSSPSSVGSDYVEEHSVKKVDVTNTSEKSYGYNDLPTSEPSSTARNSNLHLNSKADIHTLQPPNNFDDAETSDKSHIDSGMELSYGTLKGGFRNKGYIRPPYIKNTSDDVSTSLGNISIKNERLPTVRTSTNFDAPVHDKYTTESGGNRNVGSKAHNKSSDSDSYDLVADSQESISIHEPRIKNELSDAKKKSSSRTSIPFFDSDDSESEAVRHKQSSASVARPVSRVSRRTSASPKTGTVLSSDHAPSSEAPVTPGSRLGWKSSRVSYESSENRGGSKPGSAENEASKPISEPNRSLDEEIVTSSSRVQDSDPPSKQKADHVHPKLPDYDSFAAHFMSLKKGRP